MKVWSVLALSIAMGLQVEARAQVQLHLLTKQGLTDKRPVVGQDHMAVKRLAAAVEQRTSLMLAPTLRLATEWNDTVARQPWLWGQDWASVSTKQGAIRPEIVAWLRRGGLLILSGSDFRGQPESRFRQWVGQVFAGGHKPARWRPIALDHELMRSYFLLSRLPRCQDDVWLGLNFDDRLAILVIPVDLFAWVEGWTRPDPACRFQGDKELLQRAFINTLMVATATDYKKDQIHLPEILKRIR